MNPRHLRRISLFLVLGLALFAPLAVRAATNDASRELVFVDTSLPAYEQLVAAAGGREVVLLDPASDELAQITRQLTTRRGVTAVHLFSHGEPGALWLGGRRIDATVLEQRAAELRAWRTGLAAGADVLLYGCEVAGGDGGKFVNRMADLSGADVAASSRVVGNTGRETNWTLDFHAGAVSYTALAPSSYDQILSIAGTTVTFNGSAAHLVGADLEYDDGNTTFDFDPVSNRLTLHVVGATFFYEGGSVACDFTGGSLLEFTSFAINFGASSGSDDLGKITCSHTAKKLTITISSGGITSSTPDGGDIIVFDFASTDVATGPAITSATYDASSGELTVTGAGMTDGGTITVNKLTVSGEGGENRVLTSDDVTTSGTTAFSVSLNPADQAALNQILNKNGTASTGGTAYNLAAAADWHAGATADATIEVNVGGVVAPTINSAVYDAASGALVVTGTGLLKRSGANDITANKFTITGDGGGTHALIDTSDVDITSNTAFTLNLGPNDKAAVNLLLNKNGANSADGTSYNLAAAEDWNAGADSAVTIADPTGNPITASNANMAPSFNDGATQTLMVSEDGSATDITSLLDVVDPDSSQTLTWSVTTGPTKGTLGGFPTTAGTAGNASAITPSGLTYTPSLNQNGADSFVIQVSDGMATDTITVNVTITGVNDAPAVTDVPASLTADEDVAANVALSAATFADVDGDPLVVTLTASTGSLASVSAAGVTVGGTSSALTLSGTAAAINTFLDTASSVTYTGAANTNGAAAATITLNVSDGTVSPVLGTLTVNITAINDAPVAVITPASYTATEQTTLTLKGTGFSISDVDAGGATMTITLSVTEGTLNATAGGSGATVDNSGTATVTITGTLAQINALFGADATSTLSYINSLDAPAASTTLTVQASDGGATGSGGPLTGTDTATINVTAVNDAATATGLPVNLTADEDATVNVDLSAATFADVDGDSLVVTLTASTGSLASVSAAGVTVGGTSSALTLSGTAAAINTFLDTASNVTYTGAADANGAAAATITINVNDGTVNPVLGTLTVNITAINDAPVATITPASYSATEQTPLTLKGTGLSISDVDAAGATMNVTLSVGQGTLNASAGDSDATVSNSGTVSVTITGTIAQINALFAAGGTSTLGYLNSSDTPSASTTFTLQVSDGGATGSGGMLTSTDTATINITAVNDSPTVADNTGAATETGGLVTITAAMLEEGDPDDSGAGLTYTVTTTTANGTLFLDADSDNIVDGGEALGNGSTFTQADIDQGRIKYLHGGGAGSSDSFVFSLADGGADGSTPVTNQPFAITIAARPVVAAGGGAAPSYSEGAAAVAIDGGLTVTDSDSANLAGATIAITDRVAGDVLSFTDQNGIVGSFAAGTGVLTLSGVSTVGNYQTALRSITYSSTSDRPATGAGNNDRIIRFSVTDGALTSVPLDVTINVQNTNDAPVGVPTVSGTTGETQTLTADASAVTDADGLGVFSYQWQVSPDGSAGWSDVGGATVATFTLTAAEAGRHVRVKVSYTDGDGTAETVYSAASARVVSARPRNAIDLTVANDYGWGAIGGVTATDTLTIELWVSFAELGRQQNLLRLHQSGNDVIRAVPFLTDTNEVAFYLVESGGDATALVSTTRIEATDAWHHLAFVFDAGTASIYVDGQPTSIAEATAVDFALATGAAANWVALGVDRENAGPRLYETNARFDEVRVWNVVRTLAEIRHWMSEVLTGTEASLLAYYKADSTSGATLVNSVGAAENLALTGTTDADWVASGAMAPFVTSVSAISEAGFTVEWRAVYKGSGATADGYRLDIASDAGFGTLVATNINAGTGTSHTISGLSLTQNSTYHVRLRSEIDGWTSPSSAAMALTVPIIPSVQSVAVPANGTYRAGHSLDFTVSYDPDVTVNTASGTPRLQLTVGSTTRHATYQVASSTATALVFRYTVQSGDVDADGPALVSLQLNGGTINSAANGQPALLTLSSVGSTAGIVIDAPLPPEPPPAKGSQTITFAAPADTILGQTVTLSASASSGLPVSFTVLGGPATLSGSTLTTTGVGLVTVRATQSGNGSYNAASPVERSFQVAVGAPPVVDTPTSVPAPEPGGEAALTVPQTNPNLTYQWQRNGENVPNGTGPTLTLPDVRPPVAGLYTYTATVPGGGSGTSEPVIVGLTTTAEVIGTAESVGESIHHPNGNVYDQVLLEGNGASITAEPSKITRLSFIDLSDDIVQVEFSGAGTLSLVMDDASTPSPSANYNQPGVDYVRGHAGIVITGANETSNLSVISVGRITAVNQTLFREDVAYDGVANVAFVAIQSTNGQFGGIRTGNVEYFASQGFTGVYAPGVTFNGPINIGDIQAHDSATPVLVVGSVDNVRICGGNLGQPNGQPVHVNGVTRVTMAPGQTSQGNALPSQANQGVLQQDGIDVTDLIIGTN